MSVCGKQPLDWLENQMTFAAAVTDFFYSRDFTTDSEHVYHCTLPMLQVAGESAGRHRGRNDYGVSAFGYTNALSSFSARVRIGWMNMSHRGDAEAGEVVFQVLTAKQAQMLFSTCIEMVGANVSAIQRYPDQSSLGTTGQYLNAMRQGINLHAKALSAMFEMEE